MTVRSLALLSVLVSVAGCDGNAPDTLADVAGEYEPTRFVITGVNGEGNADDFLALGGTFTLRITADGRFPGGRSRRGRR